MNYVFSTCSTSVSFCEYSPHAKNRVPQVLRKVTIKGGANVAQRKTLITPKGVATPVSDEDLAFLLQDPNFKKMQQKGFFTVGMKEDDLKSAVAGMTPKDGTAPKTAKDFEKEVKVGAPAEAA